MSPLAFNASSVFEDVSQFTFDVRSAFDDLSSRIPLAFQLNSCQSDSRVSSYEAVASGSGLVSVV